MLNKKARSLISKLRTKIRPAPLSAKMPPDWDEEGYLSWYPDVKAAVESGILSSGFEHWVRYGRLEGRKVVAGQISPETIIDPVRSRQRWAEGYTVVRDSAGLTALIGELLSAGDQRASVQMPAAISSSEGALFAVDLCDSGPFESLMVELTSKCNLRCVYCRKRNEAFYQVSGRDMDMPLDSVRRAADLSAALGPKTVWLGGTGETTMLPDWMDRCKAFEGASKPTFNINTNLARVLSDTEINYMAGFDRIHISIDTADAALLQEMRKKVNLQTIVYNVVRLRAAAIGQARPLPHLAVNCVLTNKIVGHLLDLAALCVALGVHGLGLVDLNEHPAAQQAGLRSVRSSGDQDFASFRAEIESVRAFLSANHLELSMSPTLTMRLDNDENAEPAPAVGRTRMCLQPWERINVAADEAIFPCCVAGEKVGRLDDFEKLGAPEGVRAFRKRLLVGDMPSPCVTCINARLGDPAELQAAVAQRLFEAGRARPLNLLSPDSGGFPASIAPLSTLSKGKSP